MLAGLLAEPKIRTGVLTTGGNAARPFGFKTRSNRGRIVSAGSPYHAVRRPTGTFLGVLKVAPADRPGVAAGRRAAGGAGRPRRRPPTGRRSSTTRPATGTACSRCARWTARRASRRPSARRSTPPRCRPRTPPSSSAGARSRPTTSPRCCSSASSAPACTSTRRACARCSGRAPARPPRSSAPREEILEHDEDRELLNSAVKGADGFFTTFFVSTYSKYIARWAARRGLTPNQVTMFSIVRRRARRGVLRLRRALEHGAGRRARLLRVRLRLRRRPARPLHAPVLQARRLARLDLRPHEGVRRVRRPGDRREPHRRPGVDPRRRRARAADLAPRDRLLVPRLPAPGDRRRAAAADREPVRRPAPGRAADRAGRDRRGRGRRTRRRRSRPRPSR